MTKEPDWEKEYSERFYGKKKLSDGSSSEYIRLKGTAFDKDVKDFIAETLSLQRQRIVEEIKGMNRHIPENGPSFPDDQEETEAIGYNQALSDAIKKINHE